MSKKPNIFQPPDTTRMNVLAGAPLAPFKRRAFALLIDFMVAGIAFVPVILLVDRLGHWTGLYKIGSDVHIEISFFENWYSLIWLCLYFTLSVYFSNGKTIGKKLFRIRILSTVHERLSLWHSFERALGYGASALEAGFGFFQYFIRPDRRTIHDRIAETIVIAEPPRKNKINKKS